MKAGLLTLVAALALSGCTVHIYPASESDNSDAETRDSEPPVYRPPNPEPQPAEPPVIDPGGPQPPDSQATPPPVIDPGGPLPPDSQAPPPVIDPGGPQPPTEDPAADEPPPEGSNGDPKPSPAATLGIPPGHLPPPGLCRVWLPGVPAGQQRDGLEGDCNQLSTQVPAGAWLVYRPTKNRKQIKVWVFDTDRAGVIRVVRVYDSTSGALIREEPPHRNWGSGQGWTTDEPPGQQKKDDEAEDEGRGWGQRDRDEEPGNRGRGQGPPADEPPAVEPPEDEPPGNQGRGREGQGQKPKDDEPGNQGRGQGPPADEPPAVEPPNDEPPGNQGRGREGQGQKPKDDEPGNQGRGQGPPADEPPPADETPPPAEEADDDPVPEAVATLDIEQRYMPKPGECRVWMPGVAAGEQDGPAGDCDQLADQVPLNGWLVFRPKGGKQDTKVSVYDSRRPGVVAVIRYYDPKTGELTREEAP
jgi:hypothetical protein